MFFFFPVLAFLPSLIYLAAALLPAIILLRYVYRHDSIEKEPVGLLFSLLVMGCLSALCSGVLEGVADYFLRVVVSADSPIYIVLLAFLVGAHGITPRLTTALTAWSTRFSSPSALPRWKTCSTSSTTACP